MCLHPGFFFFDSARQQTVSKGSGWGGGCWVQVTEVPEDHVGTDSLWYGWHASVVCLSARCVAPKSFWTRLGLFCIFGLFFSLWAVQPHFYCFCFWVRTGVAAHWGFGEKAGGTNPRCVTLTLYPSRQDLVWVPCEVSGAVQCFAVTAALLPLQPRR